MSLLENTKKSIYGLQVLIAEDFSSKDTKIAAIR
jgi:hypothetical protein